MQAHSRAPAHNLPDPSVQARLPPSHRALGRTGQRPRYRRGSRRPSQYQAAIHAAKAKRVADCPVDARGPAIPYIIAAKTGIDLLRMWTAGQKSVLDGECAKCCPNDAGSTQRVPRKPFARTARYRVAEQA